MDPKPVAEPVSKARLRLWLKLLRTTSAVQEDVRRRLRDDFDTTLPRFDVMAALARFPDGLKMSEISARLRVSNGNVTGIVDRLAEDGLLVRVAVPGDRRAQRVQLTAAGRDSFTAMAAAHEGWIDQALTNMDAESTARMLQQLESILRGADDEI